jgi:hypothetical protein
VAGVVAGYRARHLLDVGQPRPVQADGGVDGHQAGERIVEVVGHQRPRRLGPAPAEQLDRVDPPPAVHRVQARR